MEPLLWDTSIEGTLRLNKTQSTGTFLLPKWMLIETFVPV